MALEDYLTVREAAEVVGCTTGRICQLLQDGTIAGVKFNGRAWAVVKKSAQEYARRSVNVGRPRVHATN